jgi:DNA-directed RNA polymerase subunit RPC12/RpoP
MFAFYGMPGPVELLILLFMCGGPVIVTLILVYFLVLRPKPKKGELIACPDCGHEVSTRARSCPNCGAPL